ncbi:sigma D regulator [Alteromonas facilis]|uniref:sigma D regulator n=1 Tax=Alteromonas facilis TaxID=2048004 RepID=UPI000C28EAE2|nr:sigma D regulator [Alteromonas facilis]
MLSQAEYETNRFYDVNSVLNNWLNERQQLWVEYCQLAGLTANKSQNGNKQLPTHQQLEQFCELLMDYVSAGHFEVFDIIASEDPSGESLRESLYPELMDTTDAALEFNDSYSSVEEIVNPKMFEQSVANLGETLAVRFELEDRLIQHLSDHFLSGENAPA